MAFKMKNGSMAKMVKEAGNNRVSPMKDKLPTPEEDKALLSFGKRRWWVVCLSPVVGFPL